MNEPDNKSVLMFEKFMEHGEVTAPALPGDLGFDVACAEDAVIMPDGVTRIPLGVKIASPEGYGFTFITRSSAVQRGLFCLPGLVDTGYRGPLFLFMVNFSGKPIEVKAGESLVQIVLLHHTTEEVHVVEVESLPPSARGENGFGSTGKAAGGSK